jgi:membrane protein implicated in regulation of membrane protease activity
MTPALIWFLVGFALVLVEFALPGVIIVFLGLGAWVTALFVWLGWADSVGAQTTVFMISSVMLLFGLRHIFRGWFMGHSSLGDSESEMDEFLGKSARAVAAITAGGEGKPSGIRALRREIEHGACQPRRSRSDARLQPLQPPPPCKDEISACERATRPPTARGLTRRFTTSKSAGSKRLYWLEAA